MLGVDGFYLCEEVADGSCGGTDRESDMRVRLVVVMRIVQRWTYILTLAGVDMSVVGKPACCPRLQ